VSCASFLRKVRYRKGGTRIILNHFQDTSGLSIPSAIER